MLCFTIKIPRPPILRLSADKVMSGSSFARGSNGIPLSVILIAATGIYVFECKHYTGNVYGKEEAKEWLYYIGKEKYKFYFEKIGRQYLFL